MVAVARAPRRPALDLAVYSPSDAKQTSNELSLTAHYPFTAGITLPMKHVRAPRPVREDAHGRRPRTFATVCGPGCPTSFKIIRVTEEEQNMPPTPRHEARHTAPVSPHRRLGLHRHTISTCLANLDALHSERWRCRNASNGDQLYGESLKRLYLFSEAEAETQQISPSAGPYALDPADMLCKKALTL
ncbi:hypothetical protein HYQ44_011003 [Verticillium longisporum]|nr:hypothetical protein HYQ44_011003 [Verticillium longisporum]